MQAPDQDIVLLKDKINITRKLGILFPPYSKAKIYKVYESALFQICKVTPSYIYIDGKVKSKINFGPPSVLLLAQCHFESGRGCIV